MNGTSYGLPQRQGLYDPANERENCGVGFIAHMKGEKSHGIVDQGLTILKNLAHRGATGADPNTGDGAGIMIQIPHEFYRDEAAGLGIELPGYGEYAAGMIFLPQEPNARYFCEGTFEKILKKEGLDFLGWRNVPINESACGLSAKGTCPMVHQIFIARGSLDPDFFRMKLLLVRKQVERAVAEAGRAYTDAFYVCSLSMETVVYKGQLLAHQINEFYPELKDERIVSAVASVHQRYSTNTFPSWNRAQPFRYLSHNGEINTLKGNLKWMSAREGNLYSEKFGEHLEDLFPVVEKDGSDSANVDNVLELLHAAGRSLPESMMMLIPEAWQEHRLMNEDRKAFYEYNSLLLEPWDGPAAMVFCNGRQIGATLDRNGLRPARYSITDDDLVVMASEAGVLPIDSPKIVEQGRLRPGRMFLVDMEEGRIVSDEEIKKGFESKKNYKEWIDRNKVELADFPEPVLHSALEEDDLLVRQKVFGYSEEELKMIIAPMLDSGKEAIGSMGNDAPLAVLSNKPQLLFSYFKQLFAQVTNPPIDPIRERLVMSLRQNIAMGHNLLSELDEKKDNPFIVLDHPVMTNRDMEKINDLDGKHFRSVKIPMVFDADREGRGLEDALESLCRRAEENIRKGYNILILTDRNISRYSAPIPSILALSAVHQHLIRCKLRTEADLVVETGEARDVMHIALLLGFGAKAVNPYIAFETINSMVRDNLYVRDLDIQVAYRNYLDALGKGLLKILSRMGISTLQSYNGAQIFEAVGIDENVIDKYFTGTVSRVGGIGLAEISREVLLRHSSAFDALRGPMKGLDVGGNIRWRKDAEVHAINPKTVVKLQQAARNNDYETFREFSGLVNRQEEGYITLRSLLRFRKGMPVPLEEVEPVEDILKRFATGAMSFGSLSKEVHETMAIAMNRIGGRSNSGEGGEDSARYVPDANGDRRISATKQVAAGRFGVTANYLVNADELQIKMAQGAKPGEGGHLPGKKVSEVIGKVRNSTPGIDLISPPPHHDIYSIEDLEQLIFDLKNINSEARINVKLVSEVGVGTVAAGVSKGSAEAVLISGHDGGTGASPISSIKYVGLPWELGLSETQQTLVLNNLRSRIKVQVDGQMRTGRDVAIAALLGAEEYGFGTAALIVLGCVMMRDCHCNTCPVGVATQDPELRKKFRGKPEHLINYMTFVARELREIMAELGFRKVDEMVGRVDMLEKNEEVSHWKASTLDFSRILDAPELPASFGRYCTKGQEHGLDRVLDIQLMEKALPAVNSGEKVVGEFGIKNTDRTAGAMLSSLITRKYGEEGLPENTISFTFKGTAGQSFGAFASRGMTLRLIGEANDYVGKGLSGGKIVVRPAEDAGYVPEDNIVVGNTLLYGATAGKVFIYGRAGERFAVRNSGVTAVVEGVGDHGCEYMTGGEVVILGGTGRNFGAGMSGGLAYIYDETRNFRKLCNFEMVEIRNMDKKDLERVRELVSEHFSCTGSRKAGVILDNWEDAKKNFVKVGSPAYFEVLASAGQKGKEA